MKRRIFSFILCLLLAAGLFPSDVLAAEDWPSDISIEADAGVVMDADSGAVLYGKNMHTAYSPASITKVLTGLIVLEKCSLDEMVTFSKEAVYNVEENSSSAGYDTGDQASVKDCLYAMLLKSANEAANALAEHVAGSTEEFAKMMNEKAKELGCENSNFSNPSGLNDENHFVTAYDMALITAAAFQNEMFSKIVSTTYYKLPPNKLNPEGQGISPGNKMVKPNWPDQYRPDIIGGKTGFTSIALNTLVNCAEQNGTKLVTVVLHSKSTQYNDTKKLLDFGFKNFHSVKISDYDETFSSIGDNLKISGLSTSEKPILTVDPDSRITLPKTADFSEAGSALDYELPADAPPGAIACINYSLDSRPIGRAYLTMGEVRAVNSNAVPQALLEVTPTVIDPQAVSDSPGEAPDKMAESKALGEDTENNHSAAKGSAPPENTADNAKLPPNITSLLLKILSGVLIVSSVLGIGAFIYVKRQQKEEREKQLRRQRRAERLKEAGISEAEFNLRVRERRSSPSSAEAEIDPPLSSDS